MEDKVSLIIPGGTLSGIRFTLQHEPYPFDVGSVFLFQIGMDRPFFNREMMGKTLFQAYSLRSLRHDLYVTAVGRTAIAFDHLQRMFVAQRIYLVWRNRRVFEINVLCLF